MEIEVDTQYAYNGISGMDGFELSMDGDVLTIGPGTLGDVSYPETKIELTGPGAPPGEYDLPWAYDARNYSVFLMSDGTIHWVENDGFPGDFFGWHDGAQAVSSFATIMVPRTGPAKIDVLWFTLDKSKTE